MTFSFAQRVGGRTATAGTLTFTGHSGTNKVAFQGRISPKEKLKPGRYTLVDHGHQLCRSALCAEVAELHDREVALGRRAPPASAYPPSPAAPVATA